MIRRGSLAAWLVLVGCNGHYPVVEPYLTEGSSGQASAGSTQETSGSSEGSSGSVVESGHGSDSEAVAETSSGEVEASSSEGTSSSGDTSGGPAPICGDGHVDPEMDEECDDGEGISETCHLCSRVRRIFVTSVFLQGGKINGLTGADAYCRSLALKAKMEVPDSPIVEPKNFKALLSTSTETIADRHYRGRGPYRLVNGLQVSRNFDALFAEPLENPINVDERSQSMHVPVWTGTDVDGSPYPGIDFCGDWKDLDGTANVGDADAVDSNWIHLDVDLNPLSDCGSELPIYCVEQE